jgi:hypothetical protein
MTNSNPEVDGGGSEPGPVLRQEARKALSGRVPLAMSIALALLSGMLAGYGVRALTDGHCPRREQRCSRQAARVLVVPKASEEQRECKPRLRLLREAAPVPGSADSVVDRGVEDATDEDAAARKAERDEARAIRDPVVRSAPVDKSY